MVTIFKQVNGASLIHWATLIWLLLIVIVLISGIPKKKTTLTIALAGVAALAVVAAAWWLIPPGELIGRLAPVLALGGVFAVAVALREQPFRVQAIGFGVAAALNGAFYLVLLAIPSGELTLNSDSAMYRAGDKLTVVVRRAAKVELNAGKNWVVADASRSFSIPSGSQFIDPDGQIVSIEEIAPRIRID